MKIRSWSSSRERTTTQVRERCDLLQILKSLGVIVDVKMRGYDNGNGTVEWALTIMAEVRDE